MSPLFRIAVAAEASGVPSTLIRAWERRYRVTEPVRTPSGYRGYTEADIEVLKQLKRLTEGGVAISQAVAQLPRLKREARAPAPKPRRGDWQAMVLAAGERLDQPGVEQALEEAAAWLAPVAFFDTLVVPLVHEVGDRWHAGTLSVASEHLISQAVRARLVAMIEAAPKRKGPHVVCACLGEEQHELGLLGAALKFRHAGHRVTFLGARTPAAQLARVAEAVKADRVAVSIVVGAGAARHLKALAAALPEGVRTVVGGRGAFEHRALIRRLGFGFAQAGDAKRTAAETRPSGLRTKGLRSSRT